MALVAQHVWDGALQIQSYERLSKIGKLESERNYQLFLLSLLGILVALFTSACIIIVRQRRQSHNAIQTSELRHRLLFESSRDALLTLTPPLWQVTEANQAALQLFKASSMAQFAAIGLGDSAPRTQPDGRLSMEKAREVIATVLKTGHCSFEWQHLRLDGQPFTASVTVSKMETGAAPFLLVNVRDITESKKVEAEIRIAATAFESHEAMIITDANAVILRANRAYCEASGYTAEEIVGQNPKLFQSGRHDEHFYHELWDALVRTGFWEGEIWDRRKDGETYPKWLTITAVRGAEGEVTHYVGAHIDISERKQTEEKVREMAFTDQLTGLPNRRLLMDRLKHALHVSRRNTSHGAVLFLDLNKFKQLNDTHGHEAGDILLAEVGRRLKLAIRQVDTVARLGGDEFVVLLEDLGPDASIATDCAARVTEKIRQSLVQEYVIGELSYHCSASIGITIFMGDEVDCDQILKEADASMYKQKKNRD